MCTIHAYTSRNGEKKAFAEKTISNKKRGLKNQEVLDTMTRQQR